jgi:hypothetical protein
MATDYPNIRIYIDSDYANLPDGRLRTLMQSQGMDAEAMEGFFDDLKHVATSVGQVALKAAPSVISVAAPLLGTAIGGPLGGAIGGSLGSLASGALARATGQPAPASSGAAGAGGIGQLIGGLVGGGAPAAGNLVQTLLKPQTIQALGSMALGALGKDSIPVAGKDVPVGGFINMLKTLLGNAEAEYNAIQAASDAALPEYLQDYAGLPAGDSANDDYRAARLQALLESESSGEAGDAETEAAEGMEADWEAEQSEFELAELFESEMEMDAYESEEA